MQQIELKPENGLMELAQQLSRLDTFFQIFITNERIGQFLEENRQAVYSEISHRLQFGVKKEDFGSFEALLDQAQEYISRVAIQESESSDLNKIILLKKLISIYKKIGDKRTSVEILIEVSQKYGMDWVPLEFKKKVLYSVVAIPVEFILFESARASVIAALHTFNLEQFTSFILGLYVVIATIGFFQEQSTLKHGGAIVFNPYGNLFSLGLSPVLASAMSRAPRHILEVSTVFSAIISSHRFNTMILRPVLGAIIAVGIWTVADIIFNFTQQKIEENKENQQLNNLI